MKLRRLEIENFRGIKTLDIAVGDATVLIGENNTGKTAILDALKFALRSVRTKRGCAFEEYDFHLPTPSAEPAQAAAISIKLTFKEDNAGQWDAKQISRLNRAKILQIDSNGCSLVVLHVSAKFDATLQDFVQNFEFLNNSGAALPGVNEATLASFRNEVSYHYLSALRDAAKQFDPKGQFWRPFLKESQLNPSQRQQIEQKLAEVNNLIITSHASFEKVVAGLKQVKNVLVTSTNEDLVSIDAVPGRIFDMLSRAAVSLNAASGAKIPIGRHGEGTQSLAVLTLFSSYLQAWSQGSPIIALEEPEAHLHPSAARALWQLVSEIPGQKLITTHSGDILSEVPASNVIRLARSKGNLNAWPVSRVNLTSAQSRQFNFHVRQSRGELLFANCWILGEGETEVTLLPEVARILNINLERLGVRCVPYRQSDIGLYLTLADGMGIKWIALTDNDQQGIPDTRKIQAALNGRPERRHHICMPEENIEQHLCSNGFGNVYEGLLTPQTRSKVTVPKGDPQYWPQVAKAVAKYKTEGVQAVIAEMKNGRPIPRMLKRVIVTAANLAKARQ